MPDAAFPKVTIDPGSTLARQIAMVELAEEPVLLYPAKWDHARVNQFLVDVVEGRVALSEAPIALDITKRHPV